MTPPPQYRKQVRHYNEPGHVHELTFSCYHQKPLLTNETWMAMLSRAIDTASSKQGFELLAFVYMPEHVHLLVLPCQPDSKVEQLLYAIKRPFSYRVKQDLIQRNDPLLAELTVRERPGKECFRFWQEGPGYDRNLHTDESILAAAEYIHLNPVKRGLCVSAGDWKWSSWRAYHCPGESPHPDLPRVYRFRG